MTSTQHQLISIPVSHFVEKARWALDIAGCRYVEDKWPPGLHVYGVRRAGVAKTRSVPVVVTADGQRLTDSRDILKYVAAQYPNAAHLYPPELTDKIDHWEGYLSKRLGPITRLIAYHYVMDYGSRAELLSVTSHVEGVPNWRRMVFKLLCPVMVPLMKAGMRINAASCQECSEKVKAIFQEVSDELADGRPFIVAGATAPTAADITFAALSAIVLHPPHYGGANNYILPPSTHPDWQALKAELTATKAGQHVIHMYTQYRLPK